MGLEVLIYDRLYKVSGWCYIYLVVILFGNWVYDFRKMISFWKGRLMCF